TTVYLMSHFCRAVRLTSGDPAEYDFATSRMSLDRQRLPGFSPKTLTWNLSAAALYEAAVRREEGVISADGPLVCRTAPHTGRSPNDKFIVQDADTAARIAWGGVNRPMDVAQFAALEHDLFASLASSDLFAQACVAGADPRHCLPIHVVTEQAWHSL